VVHLIDLRVWREIARMSEAYHHLGSKNGLEWEVGDKCYDILNHEYVEVFSDSKLTWEQGEIYLCW
jgi:hypothetical protein